MEPSALPWTQPGWRDEVTDWIGARLDERGLTLAGTIETARIRAWSTVLRIPTNVGPLYFKAMTPRTAYEAPLLSMLGRVDAAAVPSVIATNTDRGWILLSDAGVPLRSLIAEDHDWQRWRGALHTYANLQIRLGTRVGEMRAIGLPDRRPATLPLALAAMLGDHDTLLLDRPGDLTSGEQAQLRVLIPRIAEIAARIDALGIPHSIDHGDFHDGNIMVDRGASVLIDWGDACVAHPFGSMLVALRSVEHTLEGTPAAADLNELRGAYLRPWERFAPRAVLDEALAYAVWLAMLIRALTWRDVLAPLTDEERGENANAVAEWLREFLDSTPT